VKRHLPQQQLYKNSRELQIEHFYTLMNPRDRQNQPFQNNNILHRFHRRRQLQRQLLK
jgi:hypothetical protein